MTVSLRIVMCALLSFFVSANRELAAVNKPIHIRCVTQDGIEDAQQEARGLIASHNVQSQLARVAYATLLISWVAYSVHGFVSLATRSCNEHENLLERVAALEVHVAASGPATPQLPVPTVTVGQRVRDGLGSVAIGTLGVMNYGLVTLLGFTALAPLQTFFAKILQDLSIITFLENKTLFKIHVLALFEALEDYSDPNIGDEQRAVLISVIEHSGNCIMRDLEHVIGYLYAVAESVSSDELQDYKAQEKDFLKNYCAIFSKVGNALAALIERVGDASSEEISDLSHQIHDQLQRMNTDFHALVNVEAVLRRN